MNICILSKVALAHHIGGMEIHLDILSAAVAALGHSVTVITTRHPEGLDREAKNGYQIYYLSNTRPARYSRSWWRESAKKVIDLHREKRFDVIWSQSFSAFYYAYRVKRFLNIPLITVSHGSGIIGHTRSEWNRIDSVKEYIGFFTKFLPEALFGYAFWYYHTLANSEAVIGVSRAAVESLQKEKVWPLKKTAIIYNGIDTSIFKPDPALRKSVREKYSIDKKAKLLLMLGVLHKQKGIQYGFQAFKKIKGQVPQAKVMVVGWGPHLDWLKQLSEELEIANDVIFCGKIPNKELPGYYNAGDLFLNPTVRVEGLSIVTVEAMSCGKPIIISKIGGTQSTIDHEVSGYFVAPKDVDSIAEQAVRILSDETLAETFGRNARLKVEEQFNQEKMAGDYLQVSREIIKQQHE